MTTGDHTDGHRRVLTGIARPLDLQDASNRHAILGTIAAFIVAAVAVRIGLVDVETDAIMDIVLFGLRAGVAVFLAWAIVRETVPDSPGAASVAMVPALGATLVWPVISLIGLLMVLLAVRIVTATTGYPPTILDLGALVALSALASVTPAGRVGAIVLAGALATLGMRAALPRRRMYLVVAVVVAVVVTIGAAVESADEGPAAWSVPDTPTMVLLGLALLGALMIRPGMGQPVSRCDSGAYTLERGDLLRGRTILVMAVVLALVLGGGETVAALSVLAVAIVATGAAQAFVHPSSDPPDNA